MRKTSVLNSFDYKGQDNLEANDGERQSSTDTVVGSVDTLVITFFVCCELRFSSVLFKPSLKAGTK